MHGLISHLWKTIEVYDTSGQAKTLIAKKNFICWFPFATHFWVTLIEPQILDAVIAGEILGTPISILIWQPIFYTSRTCKKTSGINFFDMLCRTSSPNSKHHRADCYDRTGIKLKTGRYETKPVWIIKLTFKIRFQYRVILSNVILLINDMNNM